MKKKITPDMAKLVLFGLYFLILTVERIISLVICFSGEISKLDALDFYMVALTIASIFGAYSFGIVRFRSLLLENSENGEGNEDSEGSKSSDRAGSNMILYADKFSDKVFGNLSVAAGILLLGGMVHTNGSIPPMQFVSYGMLLAAMAVHTVQCVHFYRGGDKKWLSFAYITAFSMAIPVVYHTSIELAGLFIPVEIVVSAGMVTLFTIMMRNFFVGKAESNFSLLPFLTAIIGDFLVLGLRWHEEVNLFVLIFVCITAVLWFAGSVLEIKGKN